MIVRQSFELVTVNSHFRKNTRVARSRHGIEVDERPVTREGFGNVPSLVHNPRTPLTRTKKPFNWKDPIYYETPGRQRPNQD